MSFRRDWNEFWYKPTSPTPLGLFRIVFGLIVFAYCALLFSDRYVWFSDHGVLPTATANAFNAMTTSGVRWILFLNHSYPDWVITAFFLFFMAMSITLTLGLWTRTSAIMVWICLNAAHNRNGAILNSGDTVMLVMAFYAAMSPCGHACSIDRLWRVLRGKEGDAPAPTTPWAQRLMQLQISLVYLCTALSKCQGSLWIYGTAVYYPIHLPEMARFPLPFLDGSRIWPINLLTYGTLVVEFAVAVLIWIPRLRLYVLAAAALLHVGMEYSLNIPLFELLMLNAFMAFLTEKDWLRFTSWAHKQLEEMRLQFVFDGHCDFCRSALLIVRYLDVFRLVTFIDYHDPGAMAAVPQVRWEDADVAAIAVDDSGRQYKGFSAFRAAAWCLPALWLIAPFLYVPGIPKLGRIVYRWIATHRSIMPVAPRFAFTMSGGTAGAQAAPKLSMVGSTSRSEKSARKGRDSRED